MELTQDIASTYDGGQLEVQNKGEGYLYRGEIRSVIIDEVKNELRVYFNWFAKMGEDYQWEVTDTDPYVVGLLIYTLSSIGDGRLTLSSPYTGEMAVLFPPEAEGLDPANVRGLVLSS